MEYLPYFNIFSRIANYQIKQKKILATTKILFVFVKGERQVEVTDTSLPTKHTFVYCKSLNLIYLEIKSSSSAVSYWGHSY